MEFRTLRSAFFGGVCLARFCSLFSSSSGNATYIGAGRDGILIDAGVSAKRLKSALQQRDIDPASIRAVFVTHEHSDHIQGLRVFASSHHIPVYATAGTLRGLEEAGALSDKYPVFELPCGSDAQIGDLCVHAFATSHDSLESCGFRITLPDERMLAVATDTGCITNELLNNLIGCELVMVESNHDVGMLQNGPYPYFLKRRILSDTGHLSNVACGELVSQLVERGAARLFLGHLSTENNLPELAFQTTVCALEELGAARGRDYLLTVNPKENGEDLVRF